ncbi:MAG TPA: adenylosuccinate lyase [Acholeplasmatales bacterium]|nr:adenylosuccinate lyase [Acholeplasmatales bacterium]
MIERYARKKLRNLWSDKTRFQHMLDVELATTFAFSQIGIVPKEDYEKMLKNATFEVDRILEIEKETHHDVIAFTKAVTENLQDEGKWLHYGLTSTDVVDTALALTLKNVNDILEDDLKTFLSVLKKQAIKYKMTPCMGRTHGMHAEVTSFGLKWALWYDEMMRNYMRWKAARKVIEVGKISGAVGNFANIPCRVEEIVCAKLGLDFAKISTQVISRDRHCEYMYCLAQIASTLEKIAIEIRHLSRTEVKEVEEYFAKGQKGSSAMPHKRNPIASENICGCARVVKSNLMVAFDNNILWHERDISHSSAERIILADTTTLIDYMLNRYQGILENLTVFPDKMLKNIHITHGAVFSGHLVNVLVEKGMNRIEAYDIVQEQAMIALNTDENLFTLLKKTKVGSILNDDLEKCFDVKFYLKGVDSIYKRLGLE